MKHSTVQAGSSAAELAEGFQRIRREMGVPDRFPADVEAEAQAAAKRLPTAGPNRADRRDIEFLTIDPSGSKDLDQAFAAAFNSGGGYRIHYAIADLGHFVDPDSLLEAEALKRGLTLYSPDSRAPLYPPVLGEGAASLLPDTDRPAVLWTFDLDGGTAVRKVTVERALVRSRRRLDYLQAQQEIDSDAPPEPLAVMKQVGLGRQRMERERGGVDLRVPDQQINRSPEGFELAFRTDFPVEQWNAQISLMTGMCAGNLMLRRGTGLLRTLPQPSDETIKGLRASAAALGVDWPADLPYQEFVRSQDPSIPRSAAILLAARVLFRGAGYTFFDQEPPQQPRHYAVAAAYAHVTAPLRRLADRFCNELLLLGTAEPPAWLLSRLEEAPELMKQAEKRSRELESRLVDYVEAQILAARVGQTFSAVVVQCTSKGALVQLVSPAVLATAVGADLPLGERVSVRLTSADPAKGEVRFEHLPEG